MTQEAGPPKLYDKANSFVEIRQKDDARRTVSERIGRLLGQMDLVPARDYRSRIVRQACADALGQESVTDGPRFVLRAHVVEEVRRLSDADLPRYLFYRYRYDVFPATKRTDKFPPCLQIEPTSICNYRCVFCYQTDREFTRPTSGFMGMMSFDLFRRVVDEAEGACDAVTLASRGEPLLCPDIDRMLAYVCGKFLALKINTNAWFLDERRAHALLQSGANTLVFSADAAAEPLYSRLRVNGKLERVVANIRRFHEIRARHYPDSTLITRVSGVRYTGEQDLDDMERFWRDFVDQVAFVDYNPWENTYAQPVNDVTTPCSDLWRRMFVWYNGTVNPCDVDYKSTLAVGDARVETLSEIWAGSRYAELREAHLARLRNTRSPCNRCIVV